MAKCQLVRREPGLAASSPDLAIPAPYLRTRSAIRYCREGSRLFRTCGRKRWDGAAPEGAAVWGTDSFNSMPMPAQASWSRGRLTPTPPPRPAPCLHHRNRRCSGPGAFHSAEPVLHRLLSHQCHILFAVRFHIDASSLLFRHLPSGDSVFLGLVTGDLH